jgi:hypothetical protein
MTLDFAPRTIGRLKVLGIVTAAVLGTIGVGSALVSGWMALGLPMWATVQYVRDVEQKWERRADETSALLRTLQIDALENRRQAVDRDIFDQRQRLKATASNPDPDVEWRLHERERELQAIDAQLMDLRRKR